jgi:hypothetical protein
MALFLLRTHFVFLPSPTSTPYEFDNFFGICVMCIVRKNSAGVHYDDFENVKTSIICWSPDDFDLFPYLIKDLWWTKWHWDRFFSESFGFPLSISFHRELHISEN